MGPLIPLFWTSGDVCPGFQSKGGFLACTLCCLRTIRFTSGSTPGDCIEVSMAASHVPYMLVTTVGFNWETSRTASRHAIPSATATGVTLSNYPPPPLNPDAGWALRAKGLIFTPLLLTLEPSTHDHHLPFYLFPLNPFKLKGNINFELIWSCWLS